MKSIKELEMFMKDKTDEEISSRIMKSSRVKNHVLFHLDICKISARVYVRESHNKLKFNYKLFFCNIFFNDIKEPL